MLRLVLALFFALTSISSFGTQVDSSMNLDTFWNKPLLITDNDTSCKALLKDAEAKFNTNLNWGAAYGVRGHGYAKTSTILDWQFLGGMELKEIEAYGNKYYLSYYRHPGCGGACEKNQPLVSNSPIPLKDWPKRSELAKEAPPAMSYSYMYTLSGNETPYLFIVGRYDTYKGKLYVYRLQEDAKWQPACEIGLNGKSADFKENHSYFVAQKYIDKLYKSSLNLSRGGGYSCGSMNTLWRWQNNVNYQLNLALYRPWAIAINNKWQSANSFGNYQAMIKDLEKWSLIGVSEQQAYQAYKNNLSLAIHELSKFYSQTSQWDKQQTVNMAEFALKSAISHGFGFYSYDPQYSVGEFELRKAIVNNEPLDIIENIHFDPADIDTVSERYTRQDAKESILSLAIPRPEVVDYLLKKGVNPNVYNGFSKTPLMYAAQYNYFESAKLLIEAGAKVNVGTIIPDDTCYYALKTSNMSPLHYAVRYSSQDLIELLVSNNASIYASAENFTNKTIERPIDWLTKFNNENLQDKEKLVVKRLLALPSKNERLKLSNYLNLEGEELYTKGDLSSAETKFEQAIQINHENIKTLNNYAITALKLGLQGQSLKASYQVITSKSAAKRDIASAYFNTGLACEKLNYFRFDGRRYCDKNPLEYFINAYTEYPTTGRSNAIINKIENKYKSGASCKAENSAFEVLNNSGDRIFYFLHKGSMPEIYSNIGLRHSPKPFITKDEMINLKRRKVIELTNDYYLSVYESRRSSGAPIIVDQEVCSAYSKTLIPEDSKVVYVFAANDNSTQNLEVNVNTPYLFILSGADDWQISEVGKSSSIFIIDSGKASKTESINYSTYNFPNYLKYPKNPRYHESWIHRITSGIGKPIFTKFKLMSNDKITINDNDINRAKLIVSDYKNLKFHGIGNYFVTIQDKEGHLEILSANAKVEVLNDSVKCPMQERKMQVVDCGVNSSEIGLYHTIKKSPHNSYRQGKLHSIYKGEGFFIK